MKKYFLGLAVLFIFHHAFATTYYVRTDGGTTAQCNGLGNSKYPGSGSNQSCAWHHPFDALPPQGDSGTPLIRLHGGDTLIIGAGSYEMGLNAPDARAYPACNQSWSWDCIMPAIPSGTSSAPTRILGAGWDSGCSAPPELWGSEHAAQVFTLNKSNYVTLGCLEITDHASCIEFHLNGSSPYACNRTSPPFGNWASRAIYAQDSGNVTLQDLNILSMANRGILAGRLSNWTVTRVKLIANGWAGWDGDLTQAAGSSDSGQMTFDGLEAGYNGCGETWPDKKIFGCWGQAEQGYGDGLGEAKTGANWTFKNSYFHHNTQDGLDLLYADGTGSITVQSTHAEGNAGNQIKLSGSSTVENSLVIGNCSYFQGVGYMSGNNSGGANTSSDLCRAMGNALVVNLGSGKHATVRYNTLTGEGDCLLLALGGDSTSSVTIQNNAFVGKPDWIKANQSPQPQSCMFYWDSGPSTWPVSYAGNLAYHVKDDKCPSGTVVCNQDPKFANESLASFNALPTSTSPVINAAATTASTLPTDLRARPRPTLGGYDIGAVQYQGACEDTIFGGDFSSTSPTCP